MRKRRFEFTAREQGQMIIDKLIADNEVPSGIYAVYVGARKAEDGDVVFWADVSSPPTPITEGEK